MEVKICGNIVISSLPQLLIGGCSQNEQGQEHNTNQGPKVTEVKNTNIQEPTRESGQQIAEDFAI